MITNVSLDHPPAPERSSASFHQLAFPKHSGDRVRRSRPGRVYLRHRKHADSPDLKLLHHAIPLADARPILVRRQCDYVRINGLPDRRLRSRPMARLIHHNRPGRSTDEFIRLVH